MAKATRRGKTSENVTVWSVIAVLNVAVVAMFSGLFIPEPPVAALYVQAAPQPQFGAHSSVVLQERRIRQGVPTHLSVPSISVSMPVKTGSYENDTAQWTLDDSSVFFADRSVPINSHNGTTVLYGHATWNVFGAVPQILPGAEATITTDNGGVFSYKQSALYQVSPSDTSVFNSATAPMLALITCSGPFDQYRTVALFELTGVTGYE